VGVFGVLIAPDLPDTPLTILLIKNLWYGSPVQAPGISLLDALIYSWAGFYAARRTGLIRMGVLAAGATSFVGFATLFTAIAIRTPGLLLTPFSKPFIFVILSVLLGLALGYSILAGAVGGVVGKWVASTPPRHLHA
jgi:hypothetical protein